MSEIHQHSGGATVPPAGLENTGVVDKAATQAPPPDISLHRDTLEKSQHVGFPPKSTSLDGLNGNVDTKHPEIAAGNTRDKPMTPEDTAPPLSKGSDLVQNGAAGLGVKWGDKIPTSPVAREYATLTPEQKEVYKAQVPELSAELLVNSLVLTDEVAVKTRAKVDEVKALIADGVLPADTNPHLTVAASLYEDTRAKMAVQQKIIDDPNASPDQKATAAWFQAGLAVALMRAMQALMELDKDNINVYTKVSLAGQAAYLDATKMAAIQTIKAGEAEAKGMRAKAYAGIVSACANFFAAGGQLYLSTRVKSNDTSSSTKIHTQSSALSSLQQGVSGMATSWGELQQASATVEAAHHRAQEKVFECYAQLFKTMMDMGSQGLSDKSVRDIADQIQRALQEYQNAITSAIGGR